MRANARAEMEFQIKYSLHCHHVVCLRIENVQAKVVANDMKEFKKLRRLLQRKTCK